MADYHEPVKELNSGTRDYSRALKTLQEEAEAIDWYQQRIDSSEDESLIKIMKHNRNEEMEHACMMLEWLRRNMPGWNEKMKTYLFTEEDITEIEEDETGSSDSEEEGSIGLSR